jgi:Ribonuclease G/E
MSGRRLYLDRAPGETRGVVTLDGRPERLLIARPDDIAVQQLGARVVARIASLERGLASAFLDLGQGPQAILPLTPGLVEGAAVEIEIAAEARTAKGAVARLIGPAEGAPRLLAAAASLETRLAAFAPGVAIEAGPRARDVADAAQDAALAIEHPLLGGGSIAVEPTRALTAVDVDLGARTGDARRGARAANLTAIAEAARVLRLKGLGGLVVIDLIGKGHDGAALSAAAKMAFAPDEPGVGVGPISRFGAFELVVPRGARPINEVLCDGEGRLSALSRGLALLRGLERAALADPGARLVGRAAPDAAAAASPHIGALTARIGARIEIRPDPALAGEQFEIDTL